MFLRETLSSKKTEEWLDEFIDLIEPDGYLGLVQRDRSEHGSIYVWLHIPPISFHQLPRPTPYTFRISDHPPRPDKVQHLIGSVHPGQDNLVREWKKAKAKIREDREQKRQFSNNYNKPYDCVVNQIKRRKKK